MSAITYTDTMITAVTVDDAREYRTYGRKLRLPYLATCADGRVRRVYIMQFGNAGSPYMVIGGREVFLGTDDCYRCEDARACDHCDGEGTEVVCGAGGYTDAPCSHCR